MIRFQSIYLKQNDTIIFDNLNWYIQKEEKILLKGKSGIGKTTLLKLLLGFTTPDKGSIFFNDLSISKADIQTIRDQIFYLSQDIDLKDEIIGLLLDEICEVNGIPPDKRKLANYLQLFDFDQKILNQKTNKLSGGERQRLGLLIGCLLDRPVWLLDEPTSDLDDIMKTKVADFIIQQDKTMIIVSHDSVWKNYSDLSIKDGI